MGKKRVAVQKGTTVKNDISSRTLNRLSKKKLATGTLHVSATFNNTKAVFTNNEGDALFWSSAGSLGFKGAKKGTPFAAGEVGNILGEKAKIIGIQDANVLISGAGSGREPTVRSFMAHGINLTSIKDVTPIAHNGPKKRKPRRV
ncbi:MAG: small subunit ribosomal protein S11 [Flavobacteriaceae bacterium]|jgi:small subunit ribosomal protein S11